MANFEIKEEEGIFELHINGKFESSWGEFYKNVKFDSNAKTLVYQMLRCAYEEGERQALKKVRKALGIMK